MSIQTSDGRGHSIDTSMRALQVTIKELCSCQMGILDILISNTERSCERWQRIKAAAACGDTERALYMVGDLAAREVATSERIIAAQNELKVAIGRMVARSDGMEAQFPWLQTRA